MKNHPDLDSITERADRLLDGMTIHREVFARDVKKMAEELKNWRFAHERMATRKPYEFGSGNPVEDIFSEILKGKQK